MFIKNSLLICLILSYCLPIYYIYCKYSGNSSLSNIICNKDLKNYIFMFMIIMGFFAILYEIKRNDYISLLIIILLLIGIYGTININEKNNYHYVFATILFLSIFIFMIYHYYITKSSVLFYLLCIQIILLISTIIFFYKKPFLYIEVLYALNFGIYYLYLHKFNLG